MPASIMIFPQRRRPIMADPTPIEPTTGKKCHVPLCCGAKALAEATKAKRIEALFIMVQDDGVLDVCRERGELIEPKDREIASGLK
jgi:hypothetical protein